MNSAKQVIVNGSAHEIPLPDGMIHTCVTSPPYFSLRRYQGQQEIDWPAMSYTPMPGLPPMEVEPMRCALGLEQSTTYEETVYRLRDDLSPDDLAYVIAELVKHGLIES